jgi:hypothetical protein
MADRNPTRRATGHFISIVQSMFILAGAGFEPGVQVNNEL